MTSKRDDAGMKLLAQAGGDESRYVISSERGEIDPTPLVDALTLVNRGLATKQRALEDALWHLGKVRPERVLRPIEGPAWNYRQRARLSVRHVVKKGTVLVGFHERKSSFVADRTLLAARRGDRSRRREPLRRGGGGDRLGGPPGGGGRRRGEASRKPREGDPRRLDPGLLPPERAV